MTIDYDAAKLSGWAGLPRLFLRYSGTILSGTLTGPFFWISNLMHIGFLVIGQKLPIGSWQEVESLDFENGSGVVSSWEWVPAYDSLVDYNEWHVRAAQPHVALPPAAPPRAHATQLALTSDSSCCTARVEDGRAQPAAALLLHRLL